MKTLTFTRTNHLSKLHDELLAAIPALAPAPGNAGRLEPVIRVEGLDDEIWLTVPDDADEQAIAAIVAAHDPTPPDVLPPVAERVAAVLLELPEIGEESKAKLRAALLGEQ